MSQMQLFENNNPDSNEKGIHPLHQVLEEFSLENSVEMSFIIYVLYYRV